MFNFKSSALPLPQPQDWQHRPGVPGYFITKDGRFQMLPTNDGQFVICRTKKTKKGFPIVRGPSSNPDDLRIPFLLLQEGKELAAQHTIDQGKVALTSRPAQKQHGLIQPRLEEPAHDQFWNDSAKALIAITARKLNLSLEHPEQRQDLLAAIERDDLFPDKTKEREDIIAREGSWSFSGSFEEMYPFNGSLVRRMMVAAAVQILTNDGDNISRQRRPYNRQ